MSINNITEFPCHICEGTGTIEESFNDKFINVECDHCNGKGKLDWIENIVGKRNKKPLSSLDNINIRRMMAYIKQEVEGMCENNMLYQCKNEQTLQMIMRQLNCFLDNMKSNNYVYDYSITPYIHHDKYDISINIKPCRVVDIINLRLTLK